MASVQCPLSSGLHRRNYLGAATGSSGTHSQKQTIGRVVDLLLVRPLALLFGKAGKLALLLSRGQDEANEMLRRVRVLYERLPEWIRQAGPSVVKLNTEEIALVEWPRVQSLPS